MKGRKTKMSKTRVVMSLLVVFMMWTPTTALAAPTYSHNTGATDLYGEYYMQSTPSGRWGNDTSYSDMNDTTAYVEGILYVEVNKPVILDWWFNVSSDWTGGDAADTSTIVSGGIHGSNADEGYINPGHDKKLHLVAFVWDPDHTFDQPGSWIEFRMWYDGGDDDHQNSTYWGHRIHIDDNSSGGVPAQSTVDLANYPRMIENWGFPIGMYNVYGSGPFDYWMPAVGNSSAGGVWQGKAKSHARYTYTNVSGEINTSKNLVIFDWPTCHVTESGSGLVKLGDKAPRYDAEMFGSYQFYNNMANGGVQGLYRIDINFTVGEQIHRSTATNHIGSSIPMRNGTSTYVLDSEKYSKPFTQQMINDNRTWTGITYPLNWIAATTADPAGLEEIQNFTYNSPGSWNIAYALSDGASAGALNDSKFWNSNGGGWEVPLGEFHVYAQTTLSISDTTPYASGNPGTQNVQSTNWDLNYSANAPNYLNITLEDDLYRTDWAAGIEWIESTNLSMVKSDGTKYKFVPGIGFGDADCTWNGALPGVDDFGEGAAHASRETAFGDITNPPGHPENTTLNILRYSQGPRQFQNQTFKTNRFEIDIPAGTLGGTYIAGLTWTVEQP